MRAKENVTKSMTVPDGSSICGTENPGRCHSAHRLSRMRPRSRGHAVAGARRSRASPAPRTADHHKGEGPEVGERGRKGRDIERRQGDRSEESAERHDRREAQEDEQVLPQAESPSHDPTRRATYARPPFGRARHDEGGHGRPQQAGGGIDRPTCKVWPGGI